jgi:hypothetical protein
MSDPAAKTPHPAPARRRTEALRVAFALFGAPAAWMAQVTLSQALAAYACYPREEPLRVPRWPWFWDAAVLAGLAGLIVAGAALACAFSLWPKLRREKAEKGGGIATGERRARYLAALAIMPGLLFTAAILFEGAGLLLVAPCGGGRWE